MIRIKNLWLGLVLLSSVSSYSFGAAAVDDDEIQKLLDSLIELRSTTPFLEELKTEVFIPRSKLENVRSEVITAIARWTDVMNFREKLMDYDTNAILNEYTEKDVTGLGNYLERLRGYIKYVKATLRRQGLSGRKVSSGGSVLDISASEAAEAMTTIKIPTWQIEWAQKTMSLLLDEILLVPADHILNLAQLEIIVRRLYDKKHTRPNVSETALNNVTSVLELFLAQLSATTS